MTALAIAGLLFLAIHIAPATPLRAKTVSAIGEGAYLGVFSLVSLAAIWWWVSAFNDAAHGPLLWRYADWWPWVKAVIMLLAFILAVGGMSSPNPSVPNGGRLLERQDVGQGIFAITRHPLMWGFGLWGIAHFISEPNWRGFWFFGVFALTAIGGALLQDRRKAETYGEGWHRFARKTSFIPFVALMQGRAKLSIGEIGWWRIAVAVILWALILHLHLYLFGARPLPGMA
jgi:uncharacterized membrane protein